MYGVFIQVFDLGPPLEVMGALISRRLRMVMPPIQEVVTVGGQLALAVYGAGNLLWKLFRLFFPRK